MTKQSVMVINNKELAPSEPNLEQQVATIRGQAELMKAEMSEYGIEAQDVLIPLIMLMQNTSEYVGNEAAKLGDLVDSQSQQVLGSMSAPLEVIPLKMYKNIREYDISGSSPKLRAVLPFTKANEALPFEDNVGGTPIKRFTTFNVFMLLKKEAEEGSAFPYMVRFKSSGFNAGKEVASHMFRLLYLRKLPYSVSMCLSATKEKNGTNTYAAFKVTKGTPVSAVGLATCQEALSRIGSMKEDEREELAPEAAPIRTPDVVQISSTPIY